MKSTYHTFACNNLTNFSYEAITITGSGNYVIYLKLAWNFLWNNFKQTHLWWILSHLKPVCHRAEGGSAVESEPGSGWYNFTPMFLSWAWRNLGAAGALLVPLCVACTSTVHSGSRRRLNRRAVAPARRPFRRRRRHRRRISWRLHRKLNWYI